MPITSVAVNCSASRVTITGTGFSLTPLWVVEVDGVPATYNLISATTTVAIIEIIPFPDGEYCIAPLETTLATSGGDDITTDDGDTIYSLVESGFFCAEITCSIQTQDPVTSQWKLYRFDLRIRSEETL